VRELVGQDVEISTVLGFDYDGRLRRIESGHAVLGDVRKRVYMDARNPKQGEHETQSLKGERRFRLDYIVEYGPCSFPRP